MKRLDEVAAADLLVRGAVVAVPTDTIYGLAASLARPDALDTLFRLKRRPLTQALPVLVADRADLTELDVLWSDAAERLAEAFWPGPLTIVVTAGEVLAERVKSMDGTVGLRLPDDATLRAIIRRSGALAVSSANGHGEAPCCDAEAVERVFQGHEELAGVLDDGPRANPVSSVVSVVGPWRLVREGAIDGAALAAILD